MGSIVGNGSLDSHVPVSRNIQLTCPPFCQDATATTLAIACLSDSDSSDCGFPSGATVTVGPSTLNGTYSALEGSVSVMPDCKLFGSPSVSSAECEQTFIGPQGFITALGTELTVTTGDATVMTSSTASVTFEGADMSALFVAVTVTAGNVEETSGGQVTAETCAAESSSQAGAAASATGSGGTDGRVSGVDGISIGLFGVFGMLLSML